jgi:hypothetical protein
MQQFATIEAFHTRIDKGVAGARKGCEDLRADIVAALRRLESALPS